MQNTHKLSALAIARLKEPGYYSDGGNLVLQVTTKGSKSWLFRYSQGTKKREMGLGSLATVSLAIARERAASYRLQLLDGVDPIATRAASIAKARSDAAKVMTFRQCAERCIADRRAGWKNPKHAQQWENTLATYVYPHMGDENVAEADITAVRKCLDPIWTSKTETATRVRQRIESVFDWAKAHNFRSGENPAAWKGHLQVLMAAPKKIKTVQHHVALEVSRMPAFMIKLMAHAGVAALALYFLILTAARTGEVIWAKWEEIDFKTKIWKVPAGRMKAGIEHEVPLTEGLVKWLKGLKRMKLDEIYLFPGQKPGKPISNMAMLQLLKGMDLKNNAKQVVTVHGFRSTFRQWAAENSEHSREVAEHALAHRLPDKVEAAYQRGTMLAKRRALMKDWFEFVATEGGH